MQKFLAIIEDFLAKLGLQFEKEILSQSPTVKKGFGVMSKKNEYCKFRNYKEVFINAKIISE